MHSAIDRHVKRLNSQYSHLTVTATAITIDIIITPQSLNIFVTSPNNLFSPYTVPDFCRDEKFSNALYHEQMCSGTLPREFLWP